MKEVSYPIIAAWLKSYAYGSSTSISSDTIRAVTFELIETMHLNRLIVECPKRSNDPRDTRGNFRTFLDEAHNRGYPVHMYMWSMIDYESAAKRQALVDLVQYWLGQYPDLDGIQLDGIRYKNETKVNGRPYNDPAKTAAVTQTVRMIREAVDTRYAMSAAVRVISSAGRRSGGPYTNWEKNWPYGMMVQQDTLGWLREGLIDLAYPMNYQSDTGAWVFEAQQWDVEGYGNRAVIGYPWKFNDQEHPEQLSEKIAKAQAAGMQHFCLFAFNNWFSTETDEQCWQRDRNLAAHLGNTVFAAEDTLPTLTEERVREIVQEEQSVLLAKIGDTLKGISS